jgi:hypothetical protein
MKIGDLRRSLFMDYDCRWNSMVRDVTAKHETHDEETPELDVLKALLGHLTTQARLDITFPQTKGSRIQTLFTEDAV